MNKAYLVCVEGKYLKSLVNFEVSLTYEITEALFLDCDGAIDLANELLELGYNAQAIAYTYKEIEDPRRFNKKGIFVIKMNDGSYWTWDYYGNIKTTEHITREAFLDSYKECQKRIKFQKINGKAVELQN